MSWIRHTLAALLAMTMTVIASATPALADAPGYLPIQGYLSNASGTPIDGAVSIRFRLYSTDAPTGAAAEKLFEEQVPVVNVSKGYFTVYLGDNEVLDLALFRDHPIVFVGMLVSGDTAELQPLLQLAAAPYAGYAQYAGDAQTVGGLTAEQLKVQGPVGPAGPVGPKGDTGATGVLNVSATAPITASLNNQTLTISSNSYTKTQADVHFLNPSSCYWKTSLCTGTSCELQCDDGDIVISGGCATAPGSAVRSSMPSYSVGAIDNRWSASDMTAWYCLTTTGGTLQEMRIMCCDNT